MMRVQTICFLAFVFFAAACGNQSAPVSNAAVADTSTQAVKKDSAKYPSAEELDAEYQRIPKAIGFDLFKKRMVSLEEPFSPDSALKALFPGQYYQFPSPYDDNQPISIEEWSCPTCTQKEFTGWYEEETVLFPLKDSNETRYKDTLLFTDDNGNRNVLMSFSTTEFAQDLILCGRFTCANFGLALFTEENKKWNLKTFSPALGCYGSFQMIPSIMLLKFGKNNYGCYFDNTNGGAGGPFYSDSYAFGIVNGQFKMILERVGTGRIANGKSEWKSDFIIPQRTSAFSDLEVVTAGDYYSKKSFDEAEDDTANTPGAIKDAIRSNEHFDFKIVSHYAFENGKYVFKSQDLSMAPSANK
ncbi:MAG: hypothetical protein JWP12_1454 [Bacteroidetes bacterium]|nr:hypothetical protein [Bacteroidota bacterium]